MTPHCQALEEASLKLTADQGRPADGLAGKLPCLDLLAMKGTGPPLNKGSVGLPSKLGAGAAGSDWQGEQH